MRKTMWLAVILAVLVGLPVAAQEATEAAQEPWTCPDGFQGQTLSIFNWSTYVAEDTIANFEAACGVTVEYSIFGIVASTHSPEAQTNFPAERVELRTRDTSAKL